VLRRVGVNLVAKFIMKQLKISLPDDLREKLYEVAVASGKSVAGVIRTSIERDLNRREYPETHELVEAVDWLARNIYWDLGAWWFENALARRALAAAIDEYMLAKQPSELKPVDDNRQDESPSTLGRAFAKAYVSLKNEVKGDLL
jgi:predicted transcriptional regulator